MRPATEGTSESAREVVSGQRLADARSATELWQPVSDALVRGVAHSLSNRVTSLGAFASMLAPGERWDEDLDATYAGEMRRLDELVRLVRLIPRDRKTAPEPVQLPELLPDVLTLHAVHPDVRSVSAVLQVDEGALPVWVNRSGLAHGLLVVLESAKRTAGALRDAQVSVRYEGNERSVRIMVEAEPSAEPRAPRIADRLVDVVSVAAEPLPDFERLAAAPALVRELIARGRDSAVDVALSGAGATLRYEIRLDTLLEARRRERH